jgi:hypothetical protein
MSKLVTIGADPEVLLQSAFGQYVSAVGKLPGTKTNPHPVILGSVQVDNVCAEFNVSPSETAKDFDNVVDIVYDQMIHMLRRKEAYPSKVSLASFVDTEITEECRISGCDPDWNVYTRQMNEPPDYASTNFRSAGGHIHLGIPDLNPKQLMQIVKACDLLITLPMLMCEEAGRRTLYGRAGSFRPKPYGVEYRTPSNHWIFSSLTRRWVMEQAQIAVADGHRFEIPDDLPHVIDTHDITKAAAYLSAFNINKYPLYIVHH